jgi:hypothetical protein
MHVIMTASLPQMLLEDAALTVCLRSISSKFTSPPSTSLLLIATSRPPSVVASDAVAVPRF